MTLLCNNSLFLSLSSSIFCLLQIVSFAEILQEIFLRKTIHLIPDLNSIFILCRLFSLPRPVSFYQLRQEKITSCVGAMQSNMLKSAWDVSAFPSTYPGITYCQDLDFTSRYVPGSSWSPVVWIRDHIEARRCFLLPPVLSCSLHQFLSGGMGEEVLDAQLSLMLIHSHVLLRS